MFDSIFDNLLNNLIIQLSNLLISVEILGKHDIKTNQLVLTSKQLNLVLTLNCYSSVNSTDMKVCFFVNILILIVEKEFSIKNRGYLKSWGGDFGRRPPLRG